MTTVLTEVIIKNMNLNVLAFCTVIVPSQISLVLRNVVGHGTRSA